VTCLVDGRKMSSPVVSFVEIVAVGARVVRDQRDIVNDEDTDLVVIVESNMVDVLKMLEGAPNGS
jgi:hypothetical protein